MARLADLLAAAKEPKSAKAAPPGKARKASEPDGFRRLQFLIEHQRLPPYIYVWERAIEPIPPNPVSLQALREWPNVAANLCLEPGEMVSNLETGICIQTSGKMLAFDLMKLWEHHQLFY